MHSDRTHRPLVTLVLAALCAFAFACGGGSSSPAAPTPQPQPAPAAAPTVTGISPGSGPTGGGLSVTITGTGFTSGATVSIGGTPAAGIAVATSTSITATTPAHAAGAADIVIANPDGQSGRLAGGFTFDVPVSAPPAIAAIAPASGSTSGGSIVTITGTGFASGATVTFGSTAATSVSVAGPTSMTAAAPPRSAGSVDVVVANIDGQSSRLTGAFTYVGSAPPPTPPPAPVAPTLTAITPASATTAGGTTVTLTGTGFSTGAGVSLGGTAASNVVVAGATLITATTPAHAVGGVDVVVTNADGLTGRLNGGFTYTAPAPPTPPPSTVVVITITSAGVTPSTLSIAAGTRVRFVNNDTLPHTMSSDPHPEHTQCPPINQVGLLLPGQARETDALTTIRTCGYHDHNDPDDPKWTGTIQIR